MKPTRKPPSKNLLFLVKRMELRRWKQQEIQETTELIKELVGEVKWIQHVKNCNGKGCYCHLELQMNIERYWGRSLPWYLNLVNDITMLLECDDPEEFPEEYEPILKGCPYPGDYEIGSYWTGASPDTIRFIIDRVKWAEKILLKQIRNACKYLKLLIAYDLDPENIPYWEPRILWHSLEEPSFFWGVIMSKELLQLMHKIAVKKYAKSPPKKLLFKILHEIEIKEHYGYSRSWDILVELLATWLMRNADLTLGSMCCKPFYGLDPKRYKDLYDHIASLDLFKHYVTAAKTNPWDYIGECYCLGPNKQTLIGKGQGMTPKGVVDMMVKMTMGDMKKETTKFWLAQHNRQYIVDYIRHLAHYPWHLPKLPTPEIQRILDPCVGTGRFLIEPTIMYPKAPLVLYGIEINLSLYRACLVNMAMFSNHPYTIICGDTLRLPQTCNAAHPIWDLGNRWKTPDMTPFYNWRPPLSPIGPDRFSLKAFTELNKE